MPRTFSVEAAKSDRSTCKSCNKKIALKGLRIGTHNTSKQGIDLYTKWFHPACFKKKIKKGPTSKKDIAGFDKLKPNQQKQIKKHVIDVFAKKKEETKKGNKSKPRPWKQHEQDRLLKMDEDGKSLNVMAEELQRTESAVEQKLRLLLIKKTLAIKSDDDSSESSSDSFDSSDSSDSSSSSDSSNSSDSSDSSDSSNSSDSCSDDDILNERTKKKEEKKKGKKSKPRPWRQHEQDGLLKMNEEGKSVKVMAEELQRTESATKQKLRILLIKKSLTCSVCSAQFETEKSLKSHQLRKQDIAHKQLREKKNKNTSAYTHCKKCVLFKILISR